MQNLKEQGMSLLEILLVMAVLGILVGVGAMNYLKDVKKQTLKDDLNQITYYFDVARSTSVKTSVDQVVTLSQIGTGVVMQITNNTASPTTRTVATLSNLTLCDNTNSTSCVAPVQVTYKAPHGEMCWSSACSTRDVLLRFTRQAWSAKVVLQGVFGHATVRELQ